MCASSNKTSKAVSLIWSTGVADVFIFKLSKLKCYINSIIGIIKFYNTNSLYLETKQKKDELKTELDNLKQQNKQLQFDLNKIQTSKTYKLWQKYNKLKKIFNKWIYIKN